MHELSIASAIADVAIGAADGRRVRKVEVKVGYLRQVVVASLTFAFELVTRDTLADGAELVVEQVPARVRCGGCDAETDLDRFPLRCGSCRSLAVTVIAGQELDVEWVELDEAATMAIATDSSMERLG